MAFYKGKSFRLKADGKLIFHSTESSLDISTDFEEIATKDTDGKMQLPGDYSWTVSLSNLINNAPDASTTHIDASDLIAKQLAAESLTFEMTTDVTGDMIFTGSIYVSQTTITATNGSVCTGSFSFVGDGTLTLGAVTP